MSDIIVWQIGDLIAVEHVTTWIMNKSAGVESSGQRSDFYLAQVVGRLKVLVGDGHVPSIVLPLGSEDPIVIQRRTMLHGHQRITPTHPHDRWWHVAEKGKWTDDPQLHKPFETLAALKDAAQAYAFNTHKQEEATNAAQPDPET